MPVRMLTGTGGVVPQAEAVLAKLQDRPFVHQGPGWPGGVYERDTRVPTHNITAGALCLHRPHLPGTDLHIPVLDQKELPLAGLLAASQDTPPPRRPSPRGPRHTYRRRVDAQLPRQEEERLPQHVHIHLPGEAHAGSRWCRRAPPCTKLLPLLAGAAWAGLAPLSSPGPALGPLPPRGLPRLCQPGLWAPGPGPKRPPEKTPRKNQGLGVCRVHPGVLRNERRWRFLERQLCGGDTPTSHRHPAPPLGAATHLFL